MMISTKGRYALRVMIDLAENSDNGFIPLKEIAARQEISLKYLESIMMALSKAELVVAAHGKGGGYRLSKKPEQYTAADILICTEKSLAPVACLQGAENTCKRADTCKTLPMWTELDKIITGYLKSVKLSDLV